MLHKKAWYIFFVGGLLSGASMGICSGAPVTAARPPVPSEKTVQAALARKAAQQKKKRCWHLCCRCCCGVAFPLAMLISNELGFTVDGDLYNRIVRQLTKAIATSPNEFDVFVEVINEKPLTPAQLETLNVSPSVPPDKIKHEAKKLSISQVLTPELLAEINKYCYEASADDEIKEGTLVLLREMVGPAAVDERRALVARPAGLAKYSIKTFKDLSELGSFRMILV
jgi:hypothetical protein